MTIGTQNKTLQIIDTFLSSPSDTDAEIEAVIEVFGELNKIWGRFLGVNFDVTFYKKLRPGISSDAQNVINELSKPLYDLFLCILWNRIGTPTPRAQSGTAEEFERAYLQFKEECNPIELLFYFKEQTNNLSGDRKIQADLVNNFKHEISGKGAKYNKFRSTTMFKSMIRMDLSFYLQSYSEKNNLVIEDEEKQIEFEHQGYDAYENFQIEFVNLIGLLYKLNDQIKLLDKHQRILVGHIHNKSPLIKQKISEFEKFILTTSVKKGNTLNQIKSARAKAYESLSIYLMWRYDPKEQPDPELVKMHENFSKYNNSIHKIIEGIELTKKANNNYHKMRIFRKRTLSKLSTAINNEYDEFIFALKANEKLLSIIEVQIKNKNL